MTDPSNSVSVRLLRLEEDVRELQRGQPAVIAERVTRLSADIENLRRDMNEDIDGLRSELASQRKILIGFFVSFALLAIGIALSYLLTGQPVG